MYLRPCAVLLNPFSVDTSFIQFRRKIPHSSATSTPAQGIRLNQFIVRFWLKVGLDHGTEPEGQNNNTDWHPSTLRF